GIGENNCAGRMEITKGLEFMGIKIDEEKNNQRGVALDVSAEGATVRTLVIPTDEEMMIAMDTLELTK
ncbi:MAG: acetate kinase, partial [Ruminococcaceae bacterium]|nr:acetate kinase [Oscillospiraceae bacterium]